jgi:hypothetical protein
MTTPSAKANESTKTGMKMPAVSVKLSKSAVMAAVSPAAAICQSTRPSIATSAVNAISPSIASPPPR